ncbi:hypothetical protein KUTeg_010523 [Tegillarca granosa]|uniref:Uncharacterized protein n=1 Tax=Tegillarca granosa TaxID=220873 RepID=A0ABQ9F3E1_TEGGR|nr:hypothetical protein KUTeg_010523 [Tegillarca granosa]
MQFAGITDVNASDATQETHIRAVNLSLVVENVNEMLIVKTRDVCVNQDSEAILTCKVVHRYLFVTSATGTHSAKITYVFVDAVTMATRTEVVLISLVVVNVRATLIAKITCVYANPVSGEVFKMVVRGYTVVGNVKRTLTALMISVSVKLVTMATRTSVVNLFHVVVCVKKMRNIKTVNAFVSNVLKVIH